MPSWRRDTRPLKQTRRVASPARGGGFR